MNVKVIFGENLKLCRKSHNLTQEVLAEKLEITPTHLSRIENGKSLVTAELLDALFYRGYVNHNDTCKR